MTGGRCAICATPFLIREAIEQRMLKGESVLSVFRWAIKAFPELKGVQQDSFYRHKRRHFAPTLKAARKLSDGERALRKQICLAKDVLEDRIDPAAYFGPAAIAQDIQKTEKRLDVAADQAFEDKQHASLASLSGQLLRSAELRGKMGGSLNENPQISLTVSLGELHQRLDRILGADQADRQNAARTLLGLSADPPAPLHRRDSDVSNPLGSALTIDAEPAGEPPQQGTGVNPESRPVASPGLGNGHPVPFEEPLGTRRR